MNQRIKSLLFFFITLNVGISYAQIKKQSSWQQKVDYKIDVTLSPIDSMLRGHLSFVYHNQSPDTLKEMYIHLWPNAYKNNQTAFARQKTQQSKTDFYEAEPEQRGFIDSLEFLINGVGTKWKLTDEIDIALIALSNPILPGQTITVSTPFLVRLPAVFSRMGVEDNIFCITQWYPKPAVYDVNGWNPMPYLDQGEFYSEFGSFDVSITAPSNFIIAATGDIQNPEEKEWWKQRVNNPKLNHPSNLPNKTLRFVQNNVHDFAWFASDKFQISHSEVYRKSHTIETWIFAPSDDTLERREGVNYINDAIRFYSDKVGEYPYNHATVVITPLKAGGGMEYPTITNCGSIDKTTIVHEVGHNWFYGILGSNERNYPWMDESINTYYENRSQLEGQTLPKHASFISVLEKSGGEFTSDDLFTPFEITDLLYQLQATKGKDQSGNLHSTAYTSGNYGSIIYAKIPKTFFYLQQYLGDSLFDAMMHAYYDKWKFKHPLPDDFKNHAASFTGKNLDWFFSNMLESDVKQDLSLAKIKKTQSGYELKIKQNIDAPFSISALIGDSVVHTQWYPNAGNVAFPEVNANLIRVDAFESTMDLHRNNNSYKTYGLFRKWNPIALKPLADIPSPYENRVFYSPILGANLYNKFMLGAAIYNSVLPQKRIEYLIAPMYAFGTKDLAGYGELKHNWLTTGKFQRITAGLSASRYASNNIFIDFKNLTVYERLNPYVNFEFRQKQPANNTSQNLLFSYIMANEQTHTKALFSNFDNSYNYLNAEFNTLHNDLFSPYSYRFAYQFGQNTSAFQKISAEATYTFSYGLPKKGFFVRMFGGMFLQKPDDTKTIGTEFYRAGNNSGTFDYTFSQSQFGRNELSPFSNSLFANQLLYGDAQFHVMGFSSSTDSWLTSANFRTTLPGKIPFELYADVVLINEKKSMSQTNTATYTQALYYTGGIALRLFDGIFEVHVPFFASTEINDYWTNNDTKFHQRINFSLNLNRLQPIKLLQSTNLF
jgi:hypothetical protein